MAIERKIILVIFLIVSFLTGFFPIKSLSENNGRLFPKIPVVDLVIMTPMWPTLTGGAESFCFDNTKPSEIACDGKWLYVADSNNNRVLIYDEETLELVKILGQKDAYSRIPNKKNGLDHPIAVDSDGKLLFIADLRAQKIPSQLVIYNLSTFKQIVIEVPFEVMDLAWDGSWLYTATRHKVIIYTDITRLIKGGLTTPESIKKYVIQLGEDKTECSRTLMNEVTSIDVDDKYLYVMDSKNNRVLIWKKNNLKNHAPADYVLGYYDFNCKKRVEDPAGKLEEPYDLAVNGKYIFVHASRYSDGRILVFEKKKLKSGMLASYVIGRENFKELIPVQAPTLKKLAIPRGLTADEKFLFVSDKNFYAPSVFRFNLSNLKSGVKADRVLGVFWHRNPKYDFEIVNGKMFVSGQEYLGIFNHIPNKNYTFPDLYLPIGSVGVSSDGEHLCTIDKGGPIAIYNRLPTKDVPPDITIDIPDVTGGGAASGIACNEGKLAATNSFWEKSKVLVWKSMPTRDNQPPDVVLRKFNGEPILEPYNVYIYHNILFVALHIGSKVLIYRNIDNLTDKSNPDLILGENEGLHGGIHDIFYDGKNLFISTGSGIHIYHKLPKKPRKPDETISQVNISGVRFMLDPWGIYYDGSHLWIFQGCSTHYSYIMRVSKEKTTPVYPKKLIRDDFKVYAEEGGKLFSKIMNLSESIEKEGNIQTIEEDFEQLIKKKIPSFLWFSLEMIYRLPIKEYLKKYSKKTKKTSITKKTSETPKTSVTKEPSITEPPKKNKFVLYKNLIIFTIITILAGIAIYLIKRKK